MSRVSYYELAPCYSLPMNASGAIRGMSGVTYKNEGELLADWDEVHDRKNQKSPTLVRVHEDGKRVQLRPDPLPFNLGGNTIPD